MRTHEFEANLGFSPERLPQVGSTNVEFLRAFVMQFNNIERLELRRYRRTPASLREDARCISMTRREFLGEELEKTIGKLKPTQNLSVSSRVSVMGMFEMHLPLVDLAIPKSAQAPKIIENEFRHYGISSITSGGTLFETDESYHFIGNKLFTNKEEWVNFMARCLLTRTTDKTSGWVADDRFIGHSLLRGYSVLRISANGYEDVPRLVQVIK